MQRQQAEVSKGMRGLVYAVDDTIAHNNADTHAERMECARADVEAAAAVDIGTAIPKSLMPTGRRLVYNETANAKDVHDGTSINTDNDTSDSINDETKETCITLALVFEKLKAQQW
ncbi:hypothetical protein N7527_005951 [Penicillium freii]|nr:hypothetical protein N7527_005951 [Penicillium freii]